MTEKEMAACQNCRKVVLFTTVRSERDETTVWECSNCSIYVSTRQMTLDEAILKMPKNNTNRGP